jgi:phenylalanine-4-hydroxylase
MDAFEATLAWKRGGDYGLNEALHAGTVNHLVLSDGREITGRVAQLVPGGRPVAEGLATALARLEGPVMVSRDGKALGKPAATTALVAFGAGELPERGPFTLALASGLKLTGFAMGGGEVLNLRGELAGRALELPTVAWLFVSPGLPSVAGGPADPGAWDRWFGELNAFSEGEGEVRAREKKAAALHPSLAALYREVRAMREGRVALSAERLEWIAQAAADFPGDWLLAAEVEELRALLPRPTYEARASV